MLHPQKEFVLCGSQDKQGFFLQYSINGLVFVTVKECVYCTVDLGIQANLIKVRVMAQADSRRPLTMETRVLSQVRLVMKKVALGQVFLRVLWVFPGNIIAPYSSSSSRWSYQKD